jgi:hypothetical protein
MAAEGAGPFDESGLLADARRKTDLEDFGDESFRTPLRVLLASLAEAPLNAVGTLVLRASIRRSFMRRLRAEYWIGRHPEIAEERIETPLVVVGMMRSGTTLVQRLLARDPQFYAVLGWEIGEPAPRPGTDWRSSDLALRPAARAPSRCGSSRRSSNAIHPTDAMEPDEEIVFLADAFLSHVPEASCHVPAYRAWLDEQDFTPAYRYLHRMLQLLQWQKRQRGERRERWVLKTPAVTRIPNGATSLENDPGGAARHAGAPPRARHQHLVDDRARGQPAQRLLQLQQVRAGGAQRGATTSSRPTARSWPG